VGFTHIDNGRIEGRNEEDTMDNSIAYNDKLINGNDLQELNYNLRMELSHLKQDWELAANDTDKAMLETRMDRVVSMIMLVLPTID
jgi:hypothetical protein